MKNVRTLIPLINSVATSPKNFSILLGAGVSVSAGIPLAQTDLPGLPSIVTRIKELTFLRMNPSKPPIPEQIEAWLAEQHLLQNPATLYSDAFDLVGSTSTEHRNFLKPFFEGKRPTAGHTHLAALMAEKYFACVFTTNFDDLMEEAIRRLKANESRLTPQVVAHNQSAKDLDPLDSNLKVVKLHGDFLFSDIDNTEEQTRDLRQYMREGLELFLRVGGLIVVGYSGRDESILGPLENLIEDPAAFRYPLYWVLQSGHKPPERVSRLTERAGNRASFIEAESSDQFFWELRKHLSAEEPGPKPGSDEPFPVTSRESRLAILQSAADKHLNTLITEFEAEAWYQQYQPLVIRELVLRKRDGHPSAKLSDIFGAADENPTLLILGAPGAGKTTSLKRFALEKAKEGRWIPIFVELGGYRGDLLALVRSYFHGSRSSQITQSVLENKPCYIVLDGLNETGEHYSTLVDEILALIRQYNSVGHRWIVSCRSYNYRGELDTNFYPMEVQPLVTFEVFQGLQKVIGRQRAKHWWDTMNERLRILCTNPLMLKMLLDIAVTLSEPPRTRRELIGKFLDELLLKWEPRLRESRIGSAVQKQLLSAVAYGMGASVTTISAEQTLVLISERLDELMEQTLAPDGTQPALALDEMLNNGLLRRAGLQIAFMHQAIQEYFLALDLLRRKSDMSDYVQNEQWHETLMYMSEMASNARPLIELILEHDAKLAADCLQFVKMPPQDLVDAAIKGLIRVWQKDEGLFIGSAKDIAQRIFSLAEKTKTPLLRLLSQAHSDATEKGPTNLYIKLLHEAEEWEKALEASQKLRFRNHERKFLYHAQRGISLDSVEKYEEAKKEYEKALSLDPDSGWVRGNLANTLESMKDNEGAEREYKRSLKISESAITLGNYGDLLRKLGRISEAKRFLKKSLKKDATYYGAYYQLGLIAESGNDIQKAAEFFQKAAELSGQERHFKAAGNAWEKAGRIDQAIPAWREFLDLAPTDSAAQQIYGKILHYEGRDHLFTTNRRFGSIKSFDVERGYGFIAQEDGSEIFVHYSAIEGPGWRVLNEGTRVQFEVQETPKGPKAVSVLPIGIADATGLE